MDIESINQAEDKDRLEALEFLSNRYIDNVWKHIGVHLLAAGWILSSQHLQTVLTNNMAKVILIAMFVFLQAVHSVINIPIYHHIRDLEVQLGTSNYGDLVKYYGITKKRFYWNEGIIFIIALVAVIFILLSPFNK
jgi:hypothetical protein